MGKTWKANQRHEQTMGKLCRSIERTLKQRDQDANFREGNHAEMHRDNTPRQYRVLKRFAGAFLACLVASHAMAWGSHGGAHGGNHGHTGASGGMAGYMHGGK